ncbi:MAG: hypothetical protein KAJ08_09555 [Deltaproteobacteria bacterium]|jgi:hypothetical protein|nr:hypothetical protein [Deltaproteobacteria bacterium]
MDGEIFTIQVSFVSFAVGTASTVAWVVLGMNGHALEGMLVWFITALVTLSLSRHFYNKHLLHR